jgi:bacteriocin biosynthesis cyclodehydratase domain-containing protein
VGSVVPLEPASGLAEAGLDLVLAADAGNACLDELNRVALAARVPWLATLPFDGLALWIGPLVVPGESCCWRCFQLRRASNSGYAVEFGELERAGGGRLAPAPLVAAAAGLAATMALRWLAVSDPALPGVAWALELWPRPALTEHVVYRVPRCPVCSGLADQAAPAPWAEAA